MLPSSAQIRAARALLGWSQQQLADLSGTSRRTVATYEGDGEITPAKVEAMRLALETHGITFTEEGEPEGVSKQS